MPSTIIVEKKDKFIGITRDKGELKKELLAKFNTQEDKLYKLSKVVSNLSGEDTLLGRDYLIMLSTEKVVFDSVRTEKISKGVK
jgi:hypothetical protein